MAIWMSAANRSGDLPEGAAGDVPSELFQLA